MRSPRSLRRSLGSALAAALSTLALAAPAAAKTIDFTTPAGGVTYAHVHGSGGYRLNFSENDRRYFEVRTVGHHATTRYDLRGGPVAGDRLSANFGRRGRVEMRFVPVGRPEKVPAVGWCRGLPGSSQPGYLVGRFRFRAEDGYTEARLRRVPAAREAWTRHHCRVPESFLEGHPKVQRAELSATLTGAGRRGFSAILFHRHARPSARRVHFRAFRRDERGRISIYREVKVKAPESSFAFIGGPLRPEEVEVKPPAPFGGSATFTRTAESTYEWRGDLVAKFPGLPPVHFAGPKFGASVCAGAACATKESPTLEKLLGEILEGPARGR